MHKFITILLIVFLLFVFYMPFSIANSEIYVWSQNSSNEVSTSITTDLHLESPSAILIEQNTGQILYEHNSHEQLRPASVTKVMSILLIMEALDNGKISLQDKVPCSENASRMGGSQIWLDTREELTVDEMLKAICIVSANDCTVAMAEFLEGSEEAFVSKMNEKAKFLGMNDTCFKNCHGIDEDGHLTSSYDIALMSKELLVNHPSITNYTTIYMDSLRDGKSSLVNTNKLIRNYKGATGLKTGSTSLALYNLSASATRDNLSLIAVVMKSPTPSVRFDEAKKLLDYGFSNFTYEGFAQKGEKLTSITVNKGITSSVNCVYENNSGTIIPKGNNTNIEQIINMPTSISAPISEGDVIGDISYILDGEIISKVNIVASESIKKITLGNMVEKIFFTWFRVLR